MQPSTPLALSTLLSIALISISSSVSSQPSDFTCSGLRSYKLDKYDASCSQNSISNQSVSTSTKPSQTKNFDIRRQGILMINDGKKGTYDVTDIQVFEDGIKANLSKGSVSFVAESGIEQNGTSLMKLQQVILQVNGESQKYLIAEGGHCTVQSLSNPNPLGVFLAFAPPNKYTGKVQSIYATSVVECGAKDSKGNKLSLQGMQIALR